MQKRGSKLVPIAGYTRAFPNASSVSFKGLSDEDARGYAAGMEQVAKEFPEAAALITRVYAVDSGGQGGYAARYETKTHEFQISTESHGRRARWEASHEMGHAVQEAAGLTSPGSTFGDTKAQRAILKAAGAQGKTDEELRRWLTSHVSRYAGTGIWSEAISEGIAAGYESDAKDTRAFGVKLRKLLRKRIDERKR